MFNKLNSNYCINTSISVWDDAWFLIGPFELAQRADDECRWYSSGTGDRIIAYVKAVCILLYISSYTKLKSIYSD